MKNIFHPIQPLTFEFSDETIRFIVRNRTVGRI